MLFDSWQGLGRVLLVGVPAYFALIAMLRLSGKRTLSKMNAFDFVITIALGSTLASVLTSRGVALSEGLVALAMLIGLQYVVAWAASRSERVDGLLKDDPVMLVWRGALLRDAMHRERVTVGEVLAAVRQAGHENLGDVEAVVLESSSDLSVLKRDVPAGVPGVWTLRSVEGPESGGQMKAGERGGPMDDEQILGRARSRGDGG